MPCRVAARRPPPTTTSGVVSESARRSRRCGTSARRASPKRWSQSTSPGRSCEAAVFPRSETPTAPRTPKPRSVKLSPLRTVRPMPSYGTQRISERVDAALEDEVLDQPADVVVGERGHDRGAQPEAAAQAAGDVVLAAALPHPERARGADAPLARIEAQHDLAERDEVVAALAPPGRIARPLTAPPLRRARPPRASAA